MCYQEHGEGVDVLLSVGSRTGSVTVHQEERRIQISLYVVVANETSQAGKFLPDVIICHMVVLAGAEADGIDLDQSAATGDKSVVKGRQECRR